MSKESTSSPEKPKAKDAPKPAKEASTAKVGVFTANVEERQGTPWPGGPFRAGIEGENACGYGNTEKEAVDALKARLNVK